MIIYDQVVVTLGRAREQRQVVVAVFAATVRQLARVLGDVNLATDDRLDAARRARLMQLDRTKHVAVIGQRDRRLFVCLTRLDQVGNPVGSVEQAVLGMDVQMNELGSGHGAFGARQAG